LIGHFNYKSKEMNSPKIAVIGLGYVGLPLARLFAEKYKVIGFDIKKTRVLELQNGEDVTLEVDNLLQEVLIEDVQKEKGLFVTSNADFLKNCNYYIVTVPTSVDRNNQPVLEPLISASTTNLSSINKKQVD
jgi:UDP-N-acetyl-D-galactosamine dehydrogenase